jgi:hypothetical protein
VYNGEARGGEREEVNADPGPNSLSHARRRRPRRRLGPSHVRLLDGSCCPKGLYESGICPRGFP